MLADPVSAGGGRRRGVAELTLLMVVLVAAALLTACQRDEGPEADADEPNLAALEKEPLATMTLPGGELVLNTRLENGTALGKPVHAQIVRVFAYDDPERAGEGRQAAIDASVASGWKVNLEREYPGTPIFGAKTLATGDATLSIGDYEDEGLHKVSIRLEHVRCPEERCASA